MARQGDYNQKEGALATKWELLMVRTEQGWRAVTRSGREFPRGDMTE